MEVWQKGFSDHRIRGAEDYRRHVSYIRENPIKKRLCERPEEFPYSSAWSGVELDPVPQGLKPAISMESDAARLEGAPFQNKVSSGAPEGAPFQSRVSRGVAEVALFQSHPNVAPKGAIFQSKKPSGAAESELSLPKSEKAAS
jgi:hypothetical protein